MKIVNMFLCFLILVMLSVSALARTGTEKGATNKRVVTLDTILSCQNDPLLNEVFETDAWTASADLNWAILGSNKNGLEKNVLVSKGFVTANMDESHNIDNSNLKIMLTDSSGEIIIDPNPPFCHFFPIAQYGPFDHKVDMKHQAGPIDIVIIDREKWLLNPNEIFAHADQFQFVSGVFANSSDVYFTARKGRVSIQFICKPEGLKFSRAIYFPKD